MSSSLVLISSNDRGAPISAAGRVMIIWIKKISHSAVYSVLYDTLQNRNISQEEQIAQISASYTIMHLPSSCKRTVKNDFVQNA